MKIFNLILIISTLACINSKTSDKTGADIGQVPTNEKGKLDLVTSCQLEISTATTTQNDKFVFQVKSFRANDRSCWESLKSHGLSFCANKFPCRVIYIENDHLGSDKNDTFYPDWDVLKKHGIGEFTKFKEGYGWQLAGADAMSWERKEKGFDFLLNE